MIYEIYMIKLYINNAIGKLYMDVGGWMTKNDNSGKINEMNNWWMTVVGKLWWMEMGG